VAVSFDLERRGEADSVQNFIEGVFGVRRETHHHKLWYRGHASSSFQLLPSIGRHKEYASRKKEFTSDNERQLLHRFRRRAFPHDPEVRDAGYALFLARHYGLPTRLLDWTANALFALYFCCIEHADHDGHVWAIRQREDADIQDAFCLARQHSEATLLGKSPRPEVKIIHPVYNSTRVVAQDGGFTMHGDPWQPLETCAGLLFEPAALDIERLYRWDVPGNKKGDIVRELSGLGITHRTLFPDLDGIARSLWETEVLWNGRP